MSIPAPNIRGRGPPPNAGPGALAKPQGSPLGLAGDSVQVTVLQEAVLEGETLLLPLPPLLVVKVDVCALKHSLVKEEKEAKPEVSA